MSTNHLILLPGLMSDAEVWAEQASALSGLTDCEVPDYGLCDSLAGMAQQVLAGTSAATFALAGHSMGGRVALEVLRQAPERVQRLALLDTGIHPLAPGEAGDKERAGRLALVELAQQQGMRVMGAQWVRAMVHPDVLGSALLERILDMLARSSAAQFAAQINALLNRPDAASLLSSIKCPSLVLTGREDLWSTPEQHASIASAIGGAQLCIVEHCGHLSTLEQPTAVSAAMAQWLQS